MKAHGFTSLKEKKGILPAVKRHDGQGHAENYQTLILENWESHSQFQSHFFPQSSHSHSQLSIFPRELSFSFSTLKNFLEKSHAHSRLSQISLRSLILDLASQYCSVLNNRPLGLIIRAEIK